MTRVKLGAHFHRTFDKGSFHTLVGRIGLYIERSSQYLDIDIFGVDDKRHPRISGYIEICLPFQEYLPFHLSKIRIIRYPAVLIQHYSSAVGELKIGMRFPAGK